MGDNQFGGEKVKAVHTNVGTIKTNCVVNACGVWAPYIGAMCGVTVPLVAMKHAYIVTEKIEGIEKMPNVRDHDLSIYLKLQGDALSIGGYERNPVFWDEVTEIIECFFYFSVLTCKLSFTLKKNLETRLFS